MKKMLFSLIRAENGTRTRDPNLGKVVLYQLSYFRKDFQKECPEQDSNLHASRHTHLKRARLPIPPPGHFHIRAFPSCLFFVQ